MEDHSSKFELTHLSKMCILHSLHALSPQDSEGESVSNDRVDRFCRELHEVVSHSGKYNSKKRRPSAQIQTDRENPLDVSSSSIEDFYKGKLSVEQFSLQIEQKLSEHVMEDFDHDALFRVCWKVYRERKRPDKMVTEFSCRHPAVSDDCMYYLWLIFNAVLSLEGSKVMTLSVKCLDVIMTRLFYLCGHECSSQELTYSSESAALEYPEYLKAIANYNEKFNLKSSLTCEVIQDLKDEIVDAILKKSYLTKKGHKFRNWRRRWFVLRKTIMTYYESKEKPVQKGQMILNCNTKVSEIPDQGKRRHCFEVVCGKTSKPYEISADDEKSRHDWILAIKKAIDLARLLTGEDVHVEDVPESPNDSFLANFYLIKFRTSQSIIPKWEGGVKYLKVDDSLNNVSEDEEEEEQLPYANLRASRSQSTVDVASAQRHRVRCVSSSCPNRNIDSGLDSFMSAKKSLTKCEGKEKQHVFDDGLNNVSEEEERRSESTAEVESGSDCHMHLARSALDPVLTPYLDTSNTGSGQDSLMSVGHFSDCPLDLEKSLPFILSPENFIKQNYVGINPTNSKITDDVMSGIGFPGKTL